GTQERRRLRVGVPVGDGEAVPLVGHGVLGVAAVERVTGKLRVVAKVLAAGPAVRADAVGRPEPRHADPGAGTTAGLGCGRSPSTTCRSVRQTPQARTRSRSWPGPGSGTGRSVGRSGC